MTRAFFKGAEEVLRARAADHGWRRPAIYVAVFGGCYGGLMGTFGGVLGDRLWMILFAAIKVPLLLTLTFLVCLPSFFILNTLLGVREDLPSVLHALVATQAALTILLLSLAPVTLFWYASCADYEAAILFNALIFGIASLSAQWLLRRLYEPLIAQNRRHRALLRIWLVLYAFVGIQTGWVLRPFIGSPDLPAQFFRQGAWGNAYVALAEKVRALIIPPAE